MSEEDGFGEPPRSAGDRLSAEESSPSGASLSDAERRAVYRVIAARRDVRSYRPDAVPDEVLLRVLEAAHQAPSVGFMQPWNFVLLRDADVRRRIYAHFSEVNARAAEVYPEEKKRAYQALKLQGILDAPLNLLVTCDPKRGGEHVLGRFTMPETDVYSTCLAVQNLWLAARAEGLGVGWMSIMEPPVVREILGLPEQIVPVAYLTIGYPVHFSDRPLLSDVGWRQRLPLAELIFEDAWGRPAQLASTTQLTAAVPEEVPEPAQPAVAAEAPAQAIARNRELIKPRGSLGRLEALAMQLCGLQGTAYPRCAATHLVLFAGDHGVADEHVSAYKPDTTLKMVYSYLSDGAVVNAFARLYGVPVHVVDVGVNHEFGEAERLIRKKVRRGTRNLVREAAMVRSECEAAIGAGREVVNSLGALEVLAVGEMGIGNSTSAAALIASLMELSAERVTGRGTGIDSDRLAHKQRVISRALSLHATTDPSEALARLGGFELAALVGAIEAACERRALVLLDGVITAAAALVAARRNPAVLPHLVAAHQSAEPAHPIVLEELGLTPLLKLDMYLGEGSGAVLAVGLLRAACAMMREVRTYREANLEHPEDK
ncbi:MAG TPA: nicotinate-nucleotide--dimethylbenzimidazole phosphoribosyltransferase [Polyangiales bacterium]|nr:nicotinate-nucleotide--dimethylbenzimidazole phosphoribosyltransferase [Polyangiales bacterium]